MRITYPPLIGMFFPPYCAHIAVLPRPDQVGGLLHLKHFLKKTSLKICTLFLLLFFFKFFFKEWPLNNLKSLIFFADGQASVTVSNHFIRSHYSDLMIDTHSHQSQMGFGLPFRKFELVAPTATFLQKKPLCPLLLFSPRYIFISKNKERRKAFVTFPSNDDIF